MPEATIKEELEAIKGLVGRKHDSVIGKMDLKQINMPPNVKYSKTLG